jgi:hypothetical protein
MHTSSYANELLEKPMAPTWLDAAPEIQGLCEVWDQFRAGRTMPRRADIDLVGLAEAFSGVLLAELLPDGEQAANYRYLPIDALDDRGHAGLDPALFQHIPVRGCHAASATGAPYLERHSLLSGDGVLLDYDIVFLPLAAAGGSEGFVVEALLILALELPPGA